MLELNMSTPWDTDTNYELDVSTSVVAGLPQVKICGVVIQYEGVNIPCHEPAELQFIATTGSEPYDKVLWDLRRMRNSAQRYLTFSVIVANFNRDISRLSA